MNPYKVIIIDDESIIIEGLKIVIDWEKYHCEIIGSASDGIEGLKLIKELQPDIVISDISMPDFNGIEMITEALSFCRCRFIILSGYPDFNYAKQCISLGITEYLLKPVEENELISALLKVQKELEADQEVQKAFIEIDDYSHKLTTYEQDEYLRDIINSWFDSPEEFRHTLDFYDLKLPEATAYGCIAFQIHDSTLSHHDFRENFTNSLRNIFSGTPLLFYYGNHIFIAIIAAFSVIKKEDFSAALSHMQLMSEKENIHFAIGIGDFYQEIHKLYLSCKQAVYALSYQLIRGADSVNPFGNDLKNAHFILSVPKQLWDNYEQSLYEQSFSSISFAIRKIYDVIRDLPQMSVLGMQINSLNVIMICIQHINEQDEFFSLSDHTPKCFQQISELTEIDQMEKYVENVVYGLVSSVQSDDYQKPTELITQIENYVNAHPYEDLTLSAVAQIFYVSPVYLSQVFKKQTGKLYIDYVTNIKINAAKKLLLSTNLMVYEIAEKLNYKDARYFSKLFEKKTGMKPSSFRKP